jgi:integrase
MARATRSTVDQYLHRPTGSSGTWYARVTVPRTLVKAVGQTHIRRSLQTTSKAEANLRKHAVVGDIKAQLAEMRKRPARPGEPGLSFEDAKAFREELAALRARGDEDQEEAVEGLAVDRAESLEKLYGHAAAKRWYKAATRTKETLAELMTRWLDSRDLRESTKLGHRKALAEVLEFLEDPDAHPEDVTQERVIAYIDDHLTQRGLSANTIRDRLVSLGGFWAWMATRAAVRRGVNPWKGHSINKKQHTGTRPPKRKGGFTDDELVALLEGNAQVRNWSTYAYLPDLMVLAMFSGARIESLAAMTVDRVEKHPGGYVLMIENDKTEAGTRPVGFTHPAPLAVIKRRTKALKGPALLFPELKPGGADDKLSASASKAFGRYRRACGVPDGTDFHSFRRNVATILERAGLPQGDVARFLGHKVGTLAADVYGGQRAATWALEVSRKVRYGERVERLASHSRPVAMQTGSRVDT